MRTEKPKQSKCKAIDYDGELNRFLDAYRYQPGLTGRLDNLDGVSFSQSLINEMVLWKVNRYVSLDQSTLLLIDSVKSLKNAEHRKAERVLKALLVVPGVDLPMASTFLRFRNPEVFQIIDRHAYRAVFGKSYPLYTASLIDLKVETYFGYLDKLLELCKTRHLDFQTADRLLYIFDKKINGKLG